MAANTNTTVFNTAVFDHATSHYQNGVDTSHEKYRTGISADSVPNAVSHKSRTDTESLPEILTGIFQRPPSPSHNVEHYFHGPRDINRHTKWPSMLRIHGSVLPKMIVPLSVVAAWSSCIVCISKLVHSLEVNDVLLTITGFVVGLALSFRSSTAYERFAEGRKCWATLMMAARNLARTIWINVRERHAEDPNLGKADLLSKLAALQLINAFAVSLKHRLRFEPSVEYPDLAPLLANLHTLAGQADQTHLHARSLSRVRSWGQYLGVPMAESNPRKLIKRSKENLGNTPLEVLTYLSAYAENIIENQTLPAPAHQTQFMNHITILTDVLTNAERIVNTPLPVAYTISIAQITWAYVLALPFQLVHYLSWIAIPATIFAGYIILGLRHVGGELENPFGMDINDLALDSFCWELANDIDTLTSSPAPLNNEEWMRDRGAKVLWPLSHLEYRAWEQKSVSDIRAALKAKATSGDVKRDRSCSFAASALLTKESV